ncbi:MAG TPA: hypothetical protein DIU15_14095, partial [Deltaproteobacteria bacterium]|nr:hypothetical protein [Deltaproteobacteria bacterium]
MSLPVQDPGAPRYPRALVVMVKSPQPGACKTRLCPPLTPDEAAELYVAFLEDIGRELPDEAFEGDLWVAWADDSEKGPGQDAAVPETLQSCFGAPFRFLQQRG